MGRRTILALTLVLALPAASPRDAGGAGADSRAAEGSRETDASALAARLPLHFEENRGQFHERVRFLARSRGFRTFLADDEAVFVMPVARPRDDRAFPKQGPSWSGAEVVRMRVAGAASARRAAGRAPLPGRSNYLLGPDPAKWVRGAPHFGEVRQRGVRPGVDLRWRGGDGGRLEYDFLVAPGADADGIALAFKGHDALAIDAAGDLVLRTRRGVLRHARPVAWEERDGRRRPVRVRWTLRGDGSAGFEVGPRDRRRALVIDPVVTFDTFLGGAADEEPARAALGPAGTTFLAGTTYSTDFPLADTLDGTLDGNSDAFVSRINPIGPTLVFSTYYGGFSPEVGWDLAVDALGRATVVGQTEGGIPLVNPVQETPQGTVDGFCLRLDPDGAGLSHSTYLGGISFDALYCVALDREGSAWVGGTTYSPDLPVYFAVQEVNWGEYDVVLAKFGATHRDVKQCTYIGSSFDDAAFDVAVDREDNVVVTGFTSDADFLVLAAFQPQIAALGYDAFLYKADIDGFPLFSTYLGGTADEFGNAVGTDGMGRIYVAGDTDSADFPTGGAIQGTKAAGVDGFLTKVSTGGGGILWSTFLGGSDTDIPTSLAVDGAGWVHVGGATFSADFPVVDALQEETAGELDGFVTRIDPDGTRLAWSSYLGGSEADQVSSVLCGPGGRLVVAGITKSSGFPVDGGLQDSLSGGTDGYLKHIQVPIESPADFDARLALGAIGVCTWQYLGAPSASVRVERKPLGGSWATIATVPPLVTQYDDAGIEFSSTYVYRAVAVGTGGLEDSEPTREVQVTTPAANTVVPLWPDPVSAAVDTPHRVVLSWTDRALNESQFLVFRGPSTTALTFLGSAPVNAAGYQDASARPDRDYVYRVRAQNGVGLSTLSDEALASTPATLIVTLDAARVADTGVPGRESVRLAGTWAYDAGAATAAFDPATQGVSVRFGDFSAAPMLSIAAGDPGWRLRRGRYTWRSPAGSPSRAVLVLNPGRGNWSMRIARGSISFPSDDPVRVSLEIGAEAGHAEGTWRPLARPGKWKYP